ncbi:MAG: DUF1553 domain-containing protein [Gemmataceae bacterium]
MKRFGLWMCLLTLATPALAVESVDYARDIKPILAEKCYSCHGALQAKAKLRVDTAGLMLQGGRNGPILVPGKAADSLILARVTATDEADLMPPKAEGEPLTARQVALLKAWIDQGAKAPDEPIPPDPRQHWAYQPPLRPKVPQTASGASAHLVDAFLNAEQRKLGLTLVPPAGKEVLLRRVYLDLIGLPPTRAELHAFLNDPAPDAYEKVVDQLLSRPEYGERWGRHWMDVWRYSDWSGYGSEVRESQPHIWHWRDWIIESLNDDKGYERMVMEMLAGDELAPTDPDTLRATGFLVRNWYRFNRDAWLDKTVEHTAKAFLGLTVDCCKCHEHKYDPMAQEVFYQFRAVFEPHQVRTDRLPGQPDLTKNGLPRVYDANLTTPTYLFIRGNEKNPDKSQPIAPAVPDVLGGQFVIEPVPLPVAAFYPDGRDFVIEETLQAARADVDKAMAEFSHVQRQRWGAVVDLLNAPRTWGSLAAYSQAEAAVTLADMKLQVAQAALAATTARAAADRAKYAEPPDPQLKELAAAAGRAERQLAVHQAAVAVWQAERAVQDARRSLNPQDAKSKATADKAEKDLAAAQQRLQTAQANLAQPAASYTPLGKEYPRVSSGRRLALARWIARRDNPLTARVAVNHIWLRHFGEPLVDNVFDFGLRSPKPRHAALLDWLAVEFMDSGWSMKKLHRLLVTSSAYRLDSSTQHADPLNLKIDPDNHYLWRMNTRRLEAEAVRDSVLHVAGNLDVTRGGPDIDYELGETVRRRSVYFRHAYEKQMKFLELFDGPSVNECYRRSESVVPQQALALANSVLSLEQARLLARQLAATTAKDAEPEQAFILAAFEQILTRRPTTAEMSICQTFLREQAARLADPSKLTPVSSDLTSKVPPSSDPSLRTKENLVHVLMNHNDFVTVR